MERRNFLIAWICGILYAIFPSLRPKTYGGQDLRGMLAGNSEFRRLKVPYHIEEGIPIGMFRVQSYAAQIDRDWVGIEYTEELTGSGSVRVTPAS